MFFEVVYNVVRKCDIVFYNMHKDVFNAFVGVRIFHAIAVIFNQSVFSLNGRAG